MKETVLGWKNWSHPPPPGIPFTWQPPDPQACSAVSLVCTPLLCPSCLSHLARVATSLPTDRADLGPELRMAERLGDKVPSLVHPSYRISEGHWASPLTGGKRGEERPLCCLLFPEGRNRIWPGVLLGGLEPGASCCLLRGLPNLNLCPRQGFFGKSQSRGTVPRVSVQYPCP